MFGFGKKIPQQVPLEEQISTVSKFGIRLLPDRKVDELLIARGREEYESEPFTLLLTMMGSQVEEPPWGRWFSDDIWHFDTECIEGNGSYVRIAERLAVLAKGQLPIQNPRDHVDIEAGKAWIEFQLNGESQRCNLVVEDDWVDPAIFGWFASLLERRRSPGRYMYFNLDGQDCLIGFATPVLLKQLRKETGLDFVWFK